MVGETGILGSHGDIHAVRKVSPENQVNCGLML